MEARVGEWHRRRPTGRVKGRVLRLRCCRRNRLALVQLADSSGELVTLHPLEQQLRDLLAPSFILGGCERLVLLLGLVLVVHGSETVAGVSLGVGLLFLLGLDLPNALFLERKRAPAVTDDL